MKTLTCETHRYDVFIAGDVDDARRFLRRHTLDEGLCVHLMECDYVYTGGMETGIKVGLINYPRFQEDGDAIREKAVAIGTALLDELSQTSFCLVGDRETTWFSRRPGDLSPSET